MALAIASQFGKPCAMDTEASVPMAFGHKTHHRGAMLHRLCRAMKTRWLNPRRMAVVISIASIFVIVEAPSQVTTAQKSVEKTRLELQQQGFKTDLTNFSFSTSSELRAREAILEATAPDRRVAPFNDYPDLMEPAGSNEAIAVWQQPSLRRQ